MSRAQGVPGKARVALAVAVLKRRPSGMSGREHAESLAGRLTNQDESWRQKAQRLEQQVLMLRQEVLITRVTATTKSSAEAAGPDSTVDTASQDLFGPGSEAYSTDLQTGSETPELLQPDPQPATTSPQPPRPSSPLWRAMLPHAHFLQSLCSLHRVEGNNRGLEALWFCPNGGGGALLEDSVCQLLDSVAAACRDRPLQGPGEPVLQACQVAARAMELYCSQRLPSVEFRRRVEESLRGLTELLLNNHQLSRLQAAEQLMKYLITLGSCSLSKALLIRHILSLINSLADQLWQAFQGDSGLDGFPLDQYQNSCYLFQIVEELLQGSQVRCTVEVGSDLMGFLSPSDQRVFLLSEEFPLFVICLRRLQGLLRSSDRPPDQETASFHRLDSTD